MRGVFGILLAGVGLLMAYMVLSGKLPSPGGPGGPAPANGQLTPQQSGDTGSHLGGLGSAGASGAKGATSINIVPHGSGPSGLPQLAHLGDLVASGGGMK